MQPNITTDWQLSLVNKILYLEIYVYHIVSFLVVIIHYESMYSSWFNNDNLYSGCKIERNMMNFSLRIAKSREI